MARCIEKDHVAVFQFHVVSSNMLRDPPASPDDIGMANRIQERGFPMVNVSHNGDYRRPEFEVFNAIRLKLQNASPQATLFRFKTRNRHTKWRRYQNQ